MASIVAAFAVGVSTSHAEHPPVSNDLRRDVAGRITRWLKRSDAVTILPEAHIIVELGGSVTPSLVSRLRRITKAIVELPFYSDGDLHHLDVGVSWVPLSGDSVVDTVRRSHVLAEADQALLNRDIDVRPGEPRGRRIKPGPFLTPLLIALSFALSIAVPFGIMVVAYQWGVDISPWFYWGVVLTLVIMALTQLMEGVAAMRRVEPPEAPASAPPRATAIIAAYLPNEAGTILDTLDSFFAQQYSGGLQIILAYNSHDDLPIEAELKRLEAIHPDFLALRVEHSRSKAANVNAALASVDGEFVGIFDADHQPMPDAFERAWRWMADDVGIVQGHCVVRNGDESSVARMVAVEFEQIYAVNHPGRARIQGFGIFGGSNGYWNTQLFRATRFQSRYLTEDIDSALRAVRAGARIVSDPALLSRELAPVTLRSLWRQRMRWAQGWFQVSLRHGHATVKKSGLGWRPKLGIFILLGWREVFPWAAALMWPTLLFVLWRENGLPAYEPLLALITLLTLASGPIQVAFAYRVATAEIKQRSSWWWRYLFVSVFFYAEFKNLIVRIAHLRHLLRQNEWVVTPRGHVSRVGTEIEPRATDG
ncbi:MAG: histidine kinase [Microbacterium sp.]|nr:histidine kinase [Microbacterium sp.]MBA4345378.1 histidine kinase [Microbacterium sp.]